jgi:hypothetical protein
MKKAGSDGRHLRGTVRQFYSIWQMPYPARIDTDSRQFLGHGGRDGSPTISVLYQPSPCDSTPEGLHSKDCQIEPLADIDGSHDGTKTGAARRANREVG